MCRTLHIGRSELSNENAIDSYIRAFLRPLNLIQSLLFISPYTISNNFIGRTSYISLTLSVTSIIVIIALYVVRMILNYDVDFFLMIYTLFDTIYYGLGFAMNLYALVTYQYLNISIVLNIQNLFKSQIITRNMLSNIAKHVWIILFIDISFYIVMVYIVMFMYIKDSFFTFVEAFSQMSLLAFDINIFYAVQIVSILRAALRQWLADFKPFTLCSRLKLGFRSSQVMNSGPYVPSLHGNKFRGPIPVNECQDTDAIVRQSACAPKRSQKVGVVHPKTAELTSNKDMENNNFYWKDKLKAYAVILEAFEFSKTAFQLMILYFTAETFIHAICYVYYSTEYIIRFYHNGDSGMLGADMAFGWIVKNVLAITVLSVELEYFYKAVNEALVNSLLLMANDQCFEQEKQMHKNIVRMSRLCHKFDVCNLFGLDATLPRRLLSLIATYTIVILQFILL